MKKIISLLLSIIISDSAILFCAGNIYSVKAEEVSINSFIQDGVKLIRENDAGKEFVPEIIEDETIEEAESASPKRTVAKAASNDKEEFSDTAFQTCRLIIKALKAPDKLNSIGMASGFKDWYIVQFKNEKDAESAFNYYNSCQNSIQSVMIDTVSAFICSAQFNKTQKNINETFNSWGSVETGLYDLKEYIKNNVTDKKEIVVGVIDSGIDYNNAYFNNRIVRTFFNASQEGLENDEIYTNSFHGSQVSSVIVDNTNENVKISCYKWVDDETDAAESAVLLSFLKAINDGVDIVNCSFGAVGLYDLWIDALNLAEKRNIPVFAASGNSSLNLGTYGHCFPASSESVYTVSAYGSNGLPCVWTAYGKTVDFLAPGERLPVIGVNGEIVEESGTSFSCPMALSLFAQLMTLYPNLSNKQIANLMKRSANPSDIFYDCGLFGCGVIDAIESAGLERNRAPEFSLPEGKYVDEIEVEIIAEPGCEIYYSLDESYPSKESGIPYTEPVKISDDCLFLKAVAYGNGLFRSECTKAFYRLQRVGTDEMFEISDEGQITLYSGSVYDLIIPETINGISVTGIAPGVFSNSDLVGVSFPETLTSVSFQAFQDNNSIMIADGKSIKEIEPYAFSNCKHLYIVDFPLLEKVGEFSFRYDSALSGVSFPNCLSVDRNAFQNCSSMRNVNLPKVESIEVVSFSGCEMIGEINISKLKTIGTVFAFGAFSSSEILVPLDLACLKEVPSGLFSKCSVNRVEFSNVEEIKSLPRSLEIDNLKEELSLVLPSTFVSYAYLYSLVETVKIYGSRGTYAEQWANENGFEFIEIKQDTAVINDLPDEFYDYMRYLYADVVGFNRVYQWYGSYSDINTDGKLIEGANERKFIPKENEQYPYYYCVVTSTDVGYDPIVIRTGASRYMEFDGEIPPADYSALDEILATVPEDLSIYTDESVAALSEIINSIDRNLEASNQVTVDGYVEAISNALSALKLKEHMVSFIVDNESVLSYELEYGSEITDIPPNPDKTGYTFSKWTPDIPLAMPNNSLTFTAEFEPITYYASFAVDGKEIEKVPFTVESESIAAPEVPAKEGYTGKWSEYTLAASDITANAEYTINEYTVSFVADDKPVKSETVEYGSKIVIPDNPEKEGYTFREWLPKVPETIPAEDMTFYAVFEEEKQPEINPDISIMNFVSSRTVDYRTTITFTAAADNMPEGAKIVWYKDSQRAGTGEKFTVTDAREAFTVQAKIVDKSGNTLDSTETELVKVKTDFFSKIIAFFRTLFGKLPVIEQ